MTQEQEKALGVAQKLIDNISNCPITSEEILILIKGILSNESGPSYPIYTPSPSTPPFIKPGDIYCKSATAIGDIFNEDGVTKRLYTSTASNGPIEVTPKKIIKDPETGLWRYSDNVIPEHLENSTNTRGTRGICAGDNIPNFTYEIK